MPERLTNKRAIVTGAGQGIGEAIARLFAAEGARVLVADINPDTAASVARGISDVGGAAVACRADVTSPADVEGMKDAALNVFGGIDILINNAGANVFHEPLDMPEDAWRRCLSLDLESAWLCTRSVLPGMVAQGAGAVVNIASVHSFGIIPHCFPYPVAKHGLIGLTRALGVEYAAKGIRVNAIAPGYIETEAVTAYWNGFENPAAERARAEAIHPPKRVGRPIEVAQTAVFLASDEAPFINAETIVIDGGRSAVYHD